MNFDGLQRVAGVILQYPGTNGPSTTIRKECKKAIMVLGALVLWLTVLFWHIDMLINAWRRWVQTCAFRETLHLIRVQWLRSQCTSFFFAVSENLNVVQLCQWRLVVVIYLNDIGSQVPLGFLPRMQ